MLQNYRELYGLLPEGLKNYFTELETEYHMYAESLKHQVPTNPSKTPKKQNQKNTRKTSNYFRDPELGERFFTAIERLMFYPHRELDINLYPDQDNHGFLIKPKPAQDEEDTPAESIPKVIEIPIEELLLELNGEYLTQTL